MRPEDSAICVRNHLGYENPIRLVGGDLFKLDPKIIEQSKASVGYPGDAPGEFVSIMYPPENSLIRGRH